MILFLALALVMLLVLLLRPIGERFGLYDIPQGRKHHARPVLVVGGVAMILAFKICLPFIQPNHYNISYLLLALLFLTVVGLIDDLYRLSSKKLFLAQIIAALIIIYGGDGVVVQWLGNLFGFGPIYTSWLAPLFTLICVLGVINAINMVDGMDGLAGALMLVSVGWFIVLCVLSNRPVLLQMLLVLVGIIIGFLVFNMRSPWRRVANIFMGNAGSMSLGLLITWLAVQLSGKINNEVSPIISVWVIGMPLMDMARVMIKRMREGKSPFVGDHSHVHHMLSSVGYSVEQVVLIKSVLSFLMGGIGVLGWYLKMPDWLMFYGFLVVLAVYFYLTGPGWRYICHHIERKRLLKELA